MDRIKEHLNCICLQKEVTGIHYNSTGHNSSHFQVQVRKSDTQLQIGKRRTVDKETSHKNTTWTEQTRLKFNKNKFSLVVSWLLSFFVKLNCYKPCQSRLD